MTTDLQREAADRIASEYDEQVRITPGVGHDGLRVAVACPDGRYVLLDQTGGVIVDSRDLQGSTLTVVRGGRQVHPETETVRGYDPATDLLFVADITDGDWTMIPPGRSAMVAEGGMNGRVRGIRTMDLGRSVEGMRVWEVRAGETEIRRVEG